MHVLSWLLFDSSLFSPVLLLFHLLCVLSILFSSLFLPVLSIRHSWPCRHSGQLLCRFVKLERSTLEVKAELQPHRLTEIRNWSHLSRLLRARGSSLLCLLWFGLSTSLRDELLHVSSHDTSLRPCSCGLADVHIGLPSQLLSIGAGDHSATCTSPWNRFAAHT